MNYKIFVWAAAFWAMPLLPAFVFAQQAPAAPAAVPAKEMEQMDFANGLLSRGMYDMAANEYQKFIAAYPRSTYCEEAYLAIGESLFLLQDFPKAVQALNHFRQLYPNSPRLPQALLRLAQIYIHEKKYDEAVKELGSVDIENKLSGQLAQSFYFYMGKALRGKGDAEGALKNFEKAAVVQGAGEYTSYAYEALGGVQMQKGQPAAAAEAYTKAVSTVAEGEFKGYLIYRLGEALFSAGKYEEAIAQFQQVLDQYPSLGVSKDALTNLLLARYNAGQYDYLLAVYKNNINLAKADATYFEIHFAAARALIQLKQFDEALALLDTILVLPGISEQQKQRASVSKAGILVKQNKFQEGLTLLESAGPAGSSDEGDFVQAQAYYGIGEFAKAADAFSGIINNHANSGFARASLLGMAHARQESGGHKEAAELFLKYYEGEQDQNLKSEALYAAALMQAKAKGNEQAIELGQKYLQDFPKGAYYEQTVLLLANLYAALHKSEQAVTLLEEYLTHPEAIQKPNEVYFLLGFNQQLLDQQEAALQTYAKVSAAKDPKVYVSALKNSAAIYLQQRKDSEAAAVYDRIITELDHNNLDSKTYVWICDQYLKEKKYKSVLRIAEKAETYFPTEERHAFEYFRGEALRNLGDMEQALKAYDGSLAITEKNPFSGAARIGRGLVLQQTGKLDEAKAEFQKAVDENIEDHTIALRGRYELGNVASSQKNFEEALKFYLLVATIYEDPQYCPESLLRAGSILEQLNRGPEALKSYSEIVEKYKDSPQAGPAKERIAVLGPQTQTPTQ